MKHLKSIDKMFEGNKIDEFKEYFYDFIDLDFKYEVDGPEYGVYSISLNSTDKASTIDIDKHTLLDLFETSVARLSEVEEVVYEQLIFVNGTIDMLVKVKLIMKDLFSEFTQAQKVAYFAVVNGLHDNDVLELINRDLNDMLVFNKKDTTSGASSYSWIKIKEDGRIEFPILRGMKSRAVTELPMTEKDTKWFSEIIIDDLQQDNLKELHNTTQEELREIYN